MKKLFIAVLMSGAVAFGGGTKLIFVWTRGVTGVCYPEGAYVYNINTVKNGDLEFGVAQSNWPYQT